MYWDRDITDIEQFTKFYCIRVVLTILITKWLLMEGGIDKKKPMKLIPKMYVMYNKTWDV